MSNILSLFQSKKFLKKKSSFIFQPYFVLLYISLVAKHLLENKNFTYNVEETENNIKDVKTEGYFQYYMESQVFNVNKKYVNTCD